MPGVLMTMDTTYCTAICCTAPNQIMNKVPVTNDAILLKNLTVFGGDLNGLMKVLQCKSLGMIIPILCFCDVLAQKIMGQMAIHVGTIERPIQRPLP